MKRKSGLYKVQFNFGNREFSIAKYDSDDDSWEIIGSDEFWRDHERDKIIKWVDDQPIEL